MNDVLDKKKASRRFVKIIIIIAVVVLAWPLAFLSVAFLDSLIILDIDSLNLYKNRFTKVTGEPTFVTKSLYLDKIGDMKNQLGKGIKTHLCPDEVSEDGAYFYYFGETVKPNRTFIDRFEIYISCKWNDEEFVQEKSRLSSLMGPNKARPLFSNDLFPLPSYIFVYGDGEYKYALVDENNKTIYYICLVEVSFKELVFDNSFAPKKPLWNSDLFGKVPISGEFYY